MKKLLIISVVAVVALTSTLSIIGTSNSEELAGTDKYKVIKVDGKIMFEKTKADMKREIFFLQEWH